MLALRNVIHRYRSLTSHRLASTTATAAAPHVQRRPINKLLIANRGEIACRVVRTARRLGVRTVAVYSDADARSLHVQQADEAHNIGPAASQQSYLRADRILAVAAAAGCQAIHPGYGFLSESVEFAEQCSRAGIIFMGPPASAIRDMGIKSTSKAIMAAAGVPIINGYHGDDQSDERLLREAQHIGFPLMIKAVRGGGGKGMRIAATEPQFFEALESARRESDKAFGDRAMLLERYVQSPRHVEVQVFADQYGDAVYLFERDCSVQRRHQKVIEEAPAPDLSEELRRELGEAAVRAAKAVGYVGAGTVEFILDKQDLSFHFMEMNTRLQVEHPITEMITGTDLVEWQIRVAAGEPLPLRQEQIRRRGHAFEARIYAEDPRGGFLPGAGPLEHLSTPLPLAGDESTLRVETGVRQGDEVSVHYDPMIAKLVVWGESRQQALDSLIAQLADYHITGLETNVNFLLQLARHPAFQAADVHTGFIDQHLDSLFPALHVSDVRLCQAAAALLLSEQRDQSAATSSNPFVAERDFRVNSSAVRRIRLQFDGVEHTVDVRQPNDSRLDGPIEMLVDGGGEWRRVHSTRVPRAGRLTVKCNIDGVFSGFSAVIDERSIAVFADDGKTQLVRPAASYEALLNGEADGGRAAAASKVVSPMPGVLDKMLVAAGDAVTAGQPVAVIIAMKMEHVLKAPRDGRVEAVCGVAGTTVAKGEAVVTFEVAPEEAAAAAEKVAAKA